MALRLPLRVLSVSTCVARATARHATRGTSTDTARPCVALAAVPKRRVCEGSLSHVRGRGRGTRAVAVDALCDVVTRGGDDIDVRVLVGPGGGGGGLFCGICFQFVLNLFLICVGFVLNLF